MRRKVEGNAVREVKKKKIMFVHSILYLFFLLVDSSPHSASHFFAKIYSLIKRGISFQMPGCILVTELCIAL